MKLAVPNKQALEWAGAATVALLLVFVLGAQRPASLELSSAVQLAILSGVFCLGTLAAHRLVFRFTLPRLRREIGTRWSLAFCFAALIVSGIFLTAAIPVRTPQQLRRSSLEILTTGEQNPASTGSKLLLISVQQGGSIPLNAAEFKSGNLWQAVAPTGFASNNRKLFSRLSLINPVSDRYILSFETGPSYGIVEVRWESGSQRLDLYDPLPNTRIVELHSSTFDRIARWSYFFASGILIGLALAALFAFLISQMWPAAHPKRPASPVWMIVHALPMLLVWSLVLLAFWPGLMTWDSLYQWWQMTSGEINDIHPAFHTLLNGFITRIWATPGAVAFFQIFCLSMVAGWGFYLLRRARLPASVIAISWLAFILWPVNQVFVITLWKDILYSIVLLALSLLFLQISFTNGEYLDRRFVWAFLGGLSALAALLRHNGISILILLVLLAMIYWSQARKILPAAALAILLIFLARGPLFRFNQVDTKADSWLVGMRIMHYLAAYMDKGIPLDEQSRQAVRVVWPRDIPPDYSCYLADLTVNLMPPDKIAGNLKSLQQAYFRMVLAKPAVAIHHFLCASSLVWRITQPSDGYLFSFDLDLYLDQAAYTFGQTGLSIPIHSHLPDLQNHLAAYFDHTQQWFVWRPAAYLYLTLFMGVVFAFRKRSWKHLLFLTPLIIHSITLLAVVSSQEARYQYPVFLTFCFAFALIFVEKEKPPLLQLLPAGTGGAE